ncbi:MAG: universal stress protein [Actinomycetes bacterium]
MTIVVGYSPDEHGKAALPLAVMLARSSGYGLVACSVIRRPWPASLAPREDTQGLEAQASAALDRARQGVPDDVRAEFVVSRARSVPAGLLSVAGKRQARMLVVGSSSDGRFGRIALGSTTDRLLHSADLPVTVTPRGYACTGEGAVKRITLAYGGSEQADRLAVAAAGVAVRFGVGLRLASFMVGTRADYTMTLGTEGEAGVLQEWRTEMRAALQEAVEEIGGLPEAPSQVHTAIGEGGSWDEALEDLDWLPEELLVIGSSAVAPVARVFLGSRATKILRQSPVPVVLMPRERAEELAEEAEEETTA